VIWDLRQPTLVFAGAFNPAIFSPAWIVKNLYKVPEGIEVEGIFVSDIEQQTTRPYFKGVGILAQSQRLSIFIDDPSEATMTLGDTIADAVAEALPHTPVAGIGVNFLFADPDPDADIIDKLAPRDAPEKIGQIAGTEIKTALDLGEGHILRLTRSIQDGTLSLAFNYHTPIANLAEWTADEWTTIKPRFDAACKVAADLYNIDIESLIVNSALNQ